MSLLNTVKSRLVGLLQVKRDDWWVEITTVTTRCIYYFGPFQTSTEAKAAHFGYLEDLHHEAAQGISVSIKRCNPTVLTLFEQEDETQEAGLSLGANGSSR